MSINHLAPVPFRQHNRLTALAESLDNLTSMNPYLLPIVCGMHSLTELSTFHVSTPNFDATIPQKQLRLNPQPFQHLRGTPLTQPSVHQNQQAQCLHAIHMTIRQLHEHLKSDQLNRKALQLIALQLQNDFALLRYLLFSCVGVNSPSHSTLLATWQ